MRMLNEVFNSDHVSLRYFRPLWKGGGLNERQSEIPVYSVRELKIIEAVSEMTQKEHLE